jgi:hypothetical protein
MLLSAGGFAVYRGILPVYEKLIPRFGNLDQPDNRKKAIEVFLGSKGFRRSGLDAEQLSTALFEGCRTGGDFIRIVMERVAQAQSAGRWVVYNPDNLLRILAIKRDIPGALFVHIIRDGRDIALSLSKMGGFTPLPWDRASRALPATALYWEWTIRRARQQGREIGRDYIEIHYERLVTDPGPALRELGQFLEHDLDYARICSAGLGRVRESNSSFHGEQTQGSPVNRWQQRLSQEQVSSLESMVGDCLVDLGYCLTIPENKRQTGLRERCMRLEYSSYLDAKLWLKTHTPAGKLSDMSGLELQEPVSETEPEIR